MEYIVSAKADDSEGRSALLIGRTLIAEARRHWPDSPWRLRRGTVARSKASREFRLRIAPPDGRVVHGVERRGRLLCCKMTASRLVGSTPLPPAGGLSPLRARSGGMRVWNSRRAW